MTSSPSTPRPPSVERVVAAIRAQLAGSGAVGGAFAHEALADVAREVIADERLRIGNGVGPRGLDVLASEAAARLSALSRPALTSVINATGVIIHTNLGRAPWAEAAIAAAEAAARGYLLLEMERDTGRRGRRFREAEGHLIALTGAEDALIVNNNAAAVALACGLAGRGKGVAVSRGELVEIGGGVRIPEIVRRAGARLVEVGTTNRTRVADFEAVLADGTARAVLRVHPSNFRQSGFTEVPDAATLSDLAHRYEAIVLDDLGSGALLDTTVFGLAHEPTPADALAAGADIVTFSGDKLLGGPQAGLIVGRGDLIVRLRRDPLARATRADKVTLAALAATLGLYRAGRATTEIPVWRMIAAPVDGLRARAQALVDRLDLDGAGVVAMVALEATVGGGSLPGETLPSAGLQVRARSADALLGRLRTGEPAVIARVAGGAVLLDLRTVDPKDDAALGGAVAAALGGPGGRG